MRSPTDRKAESRSYEWFEARAANLTWREPLEGGGLGVCLLAVSGLALFIGSGGSQHDRLSSPASFSEWAVACMAFGLLGTAGLIADLVFALIRGQVPPWSDSLARLVFGAVPALLLIGTLFGVIAPLFTFWIARGAQPLRLKEGAWWLSLLSLLPFLPVLAYVGYHVVHGPTYIPSLVVLLYWLASVRQVALVRIRRWTGR